MIGRFANQEMKGNAKRTSGYSLNLLTAQNKSLGAASQTLLTKVKSRLRRRKLLEHERSMGVERLFLLTLSLLSNF